MKGMALDSNGNLIRRCVLCSKEFTGDYCEECVSFNLRAKPILDRLDKLEEMIRDAHGLNVRFK
jgi:hypothetical protein